MFAPFIFIFYSFFYIFFQSKSIFGGDAGDLVTAAFLKGVAHPPGYPLYTLLGHLLTKLPLHTVAWRVTLLSSIPSALTLMILYLFISDITKNKLASLIAITSLSFSYLFWLYASVPEVFALHILISVSLLYTLYKWYKLKKGNYLVLFAFLFGLSLTHHHIALFLVPSFLYLFFQNRKYFFTKSSQWKKISLAFCLGLLPYLYVPFAAIKQPQINWSNAVNVTNFMRLVTRATYGTFQSSPVYARTLMSRLIQFPLFLEFVIADFTVIGVFLALWGMCTQFKRDRKIFTYLFLGFVFAGPLFFFYASYLLSTSFALGTVERFLLPSYIFIPIWIGEGIISVYSLLKYKHNQQLTALATNGVLLICTILPLSLLYINVVKISSISNDYAGENYSRDLLNSTGDDTILFVSRDTAVFNTQYVYFTENKWPKTILIHSFRLSNGEAIPALHIRYPQLILRPFDEKKDYVNQFIESNYHKFPIYTSSVFYVDPLLGGWVPEGLLYRFYSNKDLPKISDLVSRNKTLWSKYHDPLRNRERGDFALMPSNVLDFYKEGRMESGKLFEGTGDLKSALEFYQKAVKFDPEDVNTYYTLSRVYSKLGRCDDGKKVLTQSLTYKQTPQYFQFMSDLYLNCYKDKKKANQYSDAYKKKTSTDIKLKEL